MRRRIALFVCTFALIASSACNSGDPTSPIAAHVRWLNKGPSDYTFNLAVSCYCINNFGPVVIVVRADTVQSRTYLNSGVSVPTGKSQTYISIDEIFAQLEAAQHEGLSPIIAQYDAKLGYPVHYAIGDPNADAPEFFVSAFRTP